MKIRSISQNTDEWLEFRKGKSGGSEFGNLWISGLPTKDAMKAKLDELLIEYPKTAKAEELAQLLTHDSLAELKLASDPKVKYYNLVCEKMGIGEIDEDKYAERLDGVRFSMMARGHLLEKEAIEAFEKKTGKKVSEESNIWESEDREDIYISPDGAIVSDDGKIREAVEVKCLGNAEVVKAFLIGNYPKEYQAQILKYFVVNPDLEKLYFVIYTDSVPGLELQIFEVEREEVADRIAEARAFELAVMGMVERDANRILELSF